MSVFNLFFWSGNQEENNQTCECVVPLVIKTSADRLFAPFVHL